MNDSNGYVIRFSIESFDKCGKAKYLVNRLWIDDVECLYNLLENEKFQEFLIEKGVLDELAERE